MNNIAPLSMIEQMRSEVRKLNHGLAQLVRSTPDEKGVNTISDMITAVTRMSYLLSLPLDSGPRAEMRHTTAIGGTIKRQHDQSECVILDISLGGALIQSEIDLGKGQFVELHHPQIGNLPGVVAASTGDGAHLTFHDLDIDTLERVAQYVTDAYLT